MPFKPFDGMQKPPEGPPPERPSEEVLRLRAALKRTMEHVRTLEAEKTKSERRVAILQTSLQSAQRQLWDARALLWEYQNPRQVQQQQPPQQQPQQWPPRPSQKRSPEEPGLRATKASRSSHDPA